MRHAHWVFRRMHAPVRAGLRKAALFPVRLPGLIAGLPTEFRGTRTGCFFWHYRTNGRRVWRLSFPV